jgi:hypothetical protein
VRTRILQLAAVAGALGLLGWLLRRIGWDKIAGALQQVGVRGFIILVSLALLETTLDAAALGTAVGGRLRLGFLTALNAAGSMLNLVIPWESGEVLKGTLLGSKMPSQRAIGGTIVWNYIFRISRPAVSAVAALLACLLCRDVRPAVMGTILLGNAIAFLPYLLLRVLVRFGAAAGLVKVLRFIPGVRRHPAHWIELARSIDRDVQRFWHERRRDYLQIFATQTGARFLGWLAIYACFKLLGLPYGFAQATLVYAAMNVADYFISSLPARVGVSETAGFFVFQALGLDPALGVITFVILRVRTVATNGSLAPLAFLRWKTPSEAMG